jgi:hypothetical protein
VAHPGLPSASPAAAAAGPERRGAAACS